MDEFRTQTWTIEPDLQVEIFHYRHETPDKESPQTRISLRQQGKKDKVFVVSGIRTREEITNAIQKLISEGNLNKAGKLLWQIIGKA